MTGTALKCFKSYLSDRSQRVFLDGCLSESSKLPHGVPQRSCLGSLLFTIYSSKLFEVIKDHLPVAHAYAKDTQHYKSFKPDTTSSRCDAMELCIKAIRAWIHSDEKLKLEASVLNFSRWLIYLIDLMVDNLIMFTFPPTQHTVSLETQCPVSMRAIPETTTPTTHRITPNPASNMSRIT